MNKLLPNWKTHNFNGILAVYAGNATYGGVFTELYDRKDRYVGRVCSLVDGRDAAFLLGDTPFQTRWACAVKDLYGKDIAAPAAFVMNGRVKIANLHGKDILVPEQHILLVE